MTNTTVITRIAHNSDSPELSPTIAPKSVAVLLRISPIDTDIFSTPITE